MEGKPTPWFGQYPPDFFDIVVVDECHRGGANDESTWRGILFEHFAPAVQLGLTATPRRKDNIDTYAYFGEPVFTYSLKEGINDGFLTPFRVKQISTSLDDYVYSPDDTVLEGEVEIGRCYTEAEFNRIIEIERRERQRVEILLSQIDVTMGVQELAQDKLRRCFACVTTTPSPMPWPIWASPKRSASCLPAFRRISMNR